MIRVLSLVFAPGTAMDSCGRCKRQTIYLLKGEADSEPQCLNCWASVAPRDGATYRPRNYRLATINDAPEVISSPQHSLDAR